MDDKDKVRKLEQEVIGQAHPLINQMGINAALDNHILNDLVKKQLEYVYEQLGYYIGKTGRDWQEGDRAMLKEAMPHEWGSLDTYDDMRNSMHAAAFMLDQLLMPEMFKAIKGSDEAAVRKFLRHIAREGAGISDAWEPSVFEFLNDGDENFSWLEEEDDPQQSDS